MTTCALAELGILQRLGRDPFATLEARLRAEALDSTLFAVIAAQDQSGLVRGKGRNADVFLSAIMER